MSLEIGVNCPLDVAWPRTYEKVEGVFHISYWGRDRQNLSDANCREHILSEYPSMELAWSG